MKQIAKLLVVITLLVTTLTNSQIKNAVTETVKVYGNCGMCKTKIEKAGTIKKIAKIAWEQDTSMATITYDAKKTNQDEILKKIALAGYDSDTFLAPNDVYNNLPACCQYERVAKITVTVAPKTEIVAETPKVEIEETNQLSSIFENYFYLKDALVKTDGNTSSDKAKNMLAAINSVKTDKLEMNINLVWVKVLKTLKEDTEHITNTKDAKHQRDHFDTLSLNIYELIKISKPETPTYYQFCPMANDGKGANWLSKESNIKNPYFGSTMLSCGKVIEIIK